MSGPRVRRRRFWSTALSASFAGLFSGTLLASGLLVGCERQPASIKVKGPRDAVESVNMDPVFAPFEKKGATIALRASAFDTSGAFIGPARVKWDSSDRTVATVDQTGVVTILSSGEAQIVARTDGYAEVLEAGIPVKAVIVDKVRIVPAEGQGSTIRLGDVVKWQAEVLDDRGNVIPTGKTRWKSSSYAVTVNDSGELEGRALGTATIIVEAGNSSDRRDLEVIDWEKKKKKSG